MNTKRQIEYDDFNRFKQICDDLPYGFVLHKDSPDFQIETDDGILGIEHTLVFIPKDAIPLQAQEKYFDNVISIAKEHVELNNCPKTRTHFSFRHDLKLSKKDKIDIGIQLAKIIYRTINERNSLLPNQSFEVNKSILPEYVNSIHLIKINDNFENYWTCTRFGFVLINCVGLLQNKINEKANLYKKYLENCNNVWLLIIGHGTEPSSFIHPDKVSLEHLYKSPFERTYYFETVYGKLHTLNTEV